jgi:(R)-2-hydroxyacyl-CoA dehydratese activating ATPase
LKSEYDRITATSYSRHLFEISFDISAVNEIKANAFGAKRLFPGVKTVFYIGRQDFQAIAVNEKGKVIKFEIEDKR